MLIIKKAVILDAAGHHLSIPRISTCFRMNQILRPEWQRWEEVGFLVTLLGVLN